MHPVLKSSLPFVFIPLNLFALKVATLVFPALYVYSLVILFSTGYAGLVLLRRKNIKISKFDLTLDPCIKDLIDSEEKQKNALKKAEHKKAKRKAAVKNAKRKTQQAKLREARNYRGEKDTDDTAGDDTDTEHDYLAQFSSKGNMSLKNRKSDTSKRKTNNLSYSLVSPDKLEGDLVWQGGVLVPQSSIAKKNNTPDTNANKQEINKSVHSNKVGGKTKRKRKKKNVAPKPKT